MTTTENPINYPFEGAGPDDYVALVPSSVRDGLADDEPLVRVRLAYGGEAWVARRYEDVKVVLADLRFSRSAAIGKDVPRSDPWIREDHSILDMDPPDHTRLRKLVLKAFTTRRVEMLRPRAQQIVDTLLDEMIAKGAPGDLMEGLSWPLPMTVNCEMLGVPYEDRAKLREWTDASVALTALTPEEARAGLQSLYDYMSALLEKRRDDPRDDLLTAMMQAREDNDRLEHDEIVQLAVMLLITGHESTSYQFGNVIFNLLTHPDELAKLRANPDLVNNAVEELLRFTPLASSDGFIRIAKEDIELGNTTIRAGEGVFVDLDAANRDPRRFDDPLELRIDRESARHISFGHGVHHCLGAQLARMEFQVELSTLIRRFPDLALAVDPKDLPWRHGRLVRGLNELPVTWSEVCE
ncbi:cytochrome P450 [Kibdelosporangium aridum]|uniref:Cytochrome P450 n=1 Tax=Kibdelosporangium aridum TaxID=2030 RepID=A0A428ZDI7_KIBAR|nr:cytochrome P450 [Kibdelosporangium aridum]RSM86105.1 cytochrome P450 [Kibdelosporangium aridum]